VKIAQIVNDAISAIGITTQSGKAFSFTALGKTDYIANRGYTFTGNAADLLDKIAQGYSLRWSIQNNKIKIVSKFNNDKTPGHDSNPAVKGIVIGSPKRLGADKTGVESADFHGWEAKCLLLPEAEIGGTVELSSSTIPSSPVKLVVAEINHAGDSYGDEWCTTLKARKIS
jgi:hypothetical protein